MRHYGTIILLISALMVIGGCMGGSVHQRVESAVARSLPDVIGPAESYSVKAYGSDLHMIKGNVDRLDIVGNNVHLRNGITISRLNVVINDIAFDTRSKTIKKAGATEYSASLTETEFTRYLSERHPSLPDLKVTLQDGRIGLSAKPGVSVLRLAVRADGDLEIRDEHIVGINLKKLKVAGRNAPDSARDLLSSKLDAVFDAKDLGFDATIKSVVIGPGTVTFSGSLDLMKMVEKAGGRPSVRADLQSGPQAAIWGSPDPREHMLS